MKIKANTTIYISAIVVLLGVSLTVIMGLWTTQSTKTPKKLSDDQISLQEASASTKQSQVSENTLSKDLTNGITEVLQYDPTDIKGSYTFKEISNLYKVSVEDLALAFMVEINVAEEFKCKDLESIFADSENEIGTASVRMFISYFYGLEFISTEDVYLPQSAVEVLKQKSKITNDQLSYLQTHTVIIK